MHKTKYIMDTTDNPIIYRKALKDYRVKKRIISCQFCSYHPKWHSYSWRWNENCRWDRNYKSWKTKRRSQYHNGSREKFIHNRKIESRN